MREAHRVLVDQGDVRAILGSSSPFISLSGLAGVTVGLIASAGAVAAYWVFSQGWEEATTIQWIWWDAIAVLLTSLTASIGVTARLARKRGLRIWGPRGRFILLEMATSLAGGCILSLVLVYHRMFTAIPGTMLLFYGGALAAAAKYARVEVRYLGWIELILGALALVFVEQALMYWAIGFGLVHILYGGLMYFKDEV